MCFSTTVSFASSAAVAAVGVATLARVRHRNEALFAALPLLFAWHQFNEGMVWLGLTGELAVGALQGWVAAYMLYAMGLLPLLMPLSIWLLEPDRRRARWILPFLILGTALAVYQFWALAYFDTDVFLKGHSVVYANPGTSLFLVAIVYVIATCGALFFSGYRYIVGLGAINLIGVITVLWLKQYAFVSLWCAYAAIVSVLIYIHFHRRRAAEARGEQLRH